MHPNNNCILSFNETEKTKLELFSVINNGREKKDNTKQANECYQSTKKLAIIYRIETTKY